MPRFKDGPLHLVAGVGYFCSGDPRYGSQTKRRSKRHTRMATRSGQQTHESGDDGLHGTAPARDQGDGGMMALLRLMQAQHEQQQKWMQGQQEEQERRREEQERRQEEQER